MKQRNITNCLLAEYFVESVELRCLKPKVRTGTALEDIPDHLPDIGVFHIADAIAGPLKVIPLKGNKLDVPDYTSVIEHFPRNVINW